MTPNEYDKEGLSIHYSFAATPLGDILIASTMKGICYLAFADERTEALQSLKARYPQAHYRQQTDAKQQSAISIFMQEEYLPCDIKLHIKGTDFQMKVWEELLKIPFGAVSTYGGIAARIGRPRACRAVGTAVGENPVVLLIPCHRIIRATGEIGNYHWGRAKKKAILDWEKMCKE